MKRTLAILLILAFLLSLTACAPADTPAGTTAAATTTIPTVSPGTDFSTDEEYHYVAERRDSPEWMSGDRAVAAGNGRFWQLASRTDTDDHSSFIASLRTSGGGFERHPYKVEDHHILSALAPIPGEHYCLWFIESVHIPGTPGRNHYGPHNIVRINADGEVVASADITALIGERDISRSVGVALPDGRYFLCVEDLVCLFDGEGKLLIQTNADPSTGFPEAALTFSGTITLLLDVNGARQLYLLNETTQRLESLGQVNENNADIHLAAGDAFFDLYLFDKDLCGYSLTTGQKTKLLTFHHFDINASQVVRVLPVGKSKTGAPRFGCYVISDGLVSPVLLEHRVKEPERITLRIGTMRPEGDLPRAVNDFNYENTDYQIEVIKYAADDDASGMINFSKALAAGDIPDLLDLADLPEHTLIRQKLLRDLTPFIEADPDLSTESFLPNILDLLTHEDGSIYALTRDFSVHTMHTLRSQAGDIPDDWTFSDALAILDANPGFILPYQGGSVLSVLFCATYSVDHFVDWYNLTSSFDSPEFLTVLELISRSKTDQKSEYTTAFESFAAGEYLMFYDMALNRPLGFIDNFRARFGEDLQSPGFPGTGSTVWLQSKFAMTTHCMYPDGAWDFIRSTVLSVDGTEMPLNIPVLEAEYKACLDSWRTYYDKRVDDLRYIPTEEDFAAYDAIIRGAKAEDKTDYYVFPIMLEELETFFANEQSAVETAEAIQSRVTSLLAEMQ